MVINNGPYVIGGGSGVFNIIVSGPDFPFKFLKSASVIAKVLKDVIKSEAARIIIFKPGANSLKSD